MIDLVSKIADLQAQFQHIADRHDWVCLAMPPWGRFGVPTIGELVRPSPSPPEPVGNILDACGQPIPISKPSLLEKAEYAKAVRSIRFSDEHGRDRDASIEEVAKVIQQTEYLNSYQGMVELHGPPPWVLPPEDLRRARVTEHITVLTEKAKRLLFSVLDGPNQISADIQIQVRERERECSWWGWVLWLRYAGFVIGPNWRIEGYPQVAATALMGLRDVVGAKMEAIKPSNKVAPTGPTETTDEAGEQYVTLDQMAALVNRSKRTLERKVNAANSEAPVPDVEGGGGKPHEWKWQSIRPWLERQFNRQLPARFPR